MLKIPLPLWIAVLCISSCTTNGQETDFCVISQPIYLTKQEAAGLSDYSALEILTHNETGHDYCGWKAK